MNEGELVMIYEGINEGKLVMCRSDILSALPSKLQGSHKAYTKWEERRIKSLKVDDFKFPILIVLQHILVEPPDSSHTMRAFEGKALKPPLPPLIPTPPSRKPRAVLSADRSFDSIRLSRTQVSLQPRR